MTNLAAFLLDREAEREQQADEIHSKYEDCESLWPEPFPCTCGEPARVLADCQARRAIIELHEHVGSFLSEWDEGDPVPFESGQFGCRICALDDRQIEPEGWCDTLRALARSHRDHPESDSSWLLDEADRPDTPN